ncbi:uncharacterized protein MEPE_06825 [Melanopsichium pennsylvanicum]|uniref:Uncharacterized protein n=1 Tax=Melanopsichium pennsylvanicum TaxID=63383 RepID=A0AAJ4XT08_9BASI|nr:uncharacterized protein MEPE_06825 [Melanopsichium pennsylvanicum]
MPRSAAAAPTRRSARVASRVAVLCSMSMPSARSTPPCRCAGTPNLSGECTPSNDMVLDPAVLANEHCLTSDAAVGLVLLALSPAHRSAPLLNLSGETQAVSHPVGEPLFRYVSPPASPLVDSAVETTPERDARWARKLARSITPSPILDPDDVVDDFLLGFRPRSASVVSDAYLRNARANPASAISPEPSRVTPPPARTPTPPPRQERYVPNQHNILDWCNTLSPVVLVCMVARRFWPDEWDVPATWELPARMKLNVLSRLTEGSAPWPTWTCLPCARLDIPCFPSTFADPTAPRGRVSRDAPAHLLAPGVRGVVRAHLITPDSMHGLGSIRSWDRTVDPRNRRWFLRVMENVWYADRTISRRLVMTVYDFLTRRADLRSEHEPFESVAVAGGVPEPIGTCIPIPHNPPVPS